MIRPLRAACSVGLVGVLALGAVGCSDNRGDATAVPDATTTTVHPKAVGVACPPVVSDPTGEWAIMRDPALRKAPEPCSTIGGSGSTVLAYDSAAGTSIGWETFYVGTDGVVHQGGSGFFQGREGTFETELGVFDTDADGKAGFLRLEALSNAKSDPTGVTAGTVDKKQIALIPVVLVRSH
jgi:hypothetical protein